LSSIGSRPSSNSSMARSIRSLRAATGELLLGFARKFNAKAHVSRRARASSPRV
jgi:hypothetical protein